MNAEVNGGVSAGVGAGVGFSGLGFSGLDISKLLAGPRLIELIIAITVIEGIVLTVYFSRSGKGVAPKEFAANLLSGLCLMLALRSALIGQSGALTALFLSASGLIHAAEVWRRWER